MRVINQLQPFFTPPQKRDVKAQAAQNKEKAEWAKKSESRALDYSDSSITLSFSAIVLTYGARTFSCC